MIAITGIPLRQQRPLPPMPMVQLCNLDGGVKFYIGVNLSIDTFKEWSPERIYGFFNGIAKIIRATENSPNEPQC